MCGTLRGVCTRGYMVGSGGDAGFIESVHKYFAGTMMEARKILEPVADDKDDGDAAASSDCSAASDDD